MESKKYECPNCGFVSPIEEDISDPEFTPEKGYTYKEGYCPGCETILFITQEKN